MNSEQLREEYRRETGETAKTFKKDVVFTEEYVEWVEKKAAGHHVQFDKLIEKLFVVIPPCDEENSLGKGAEWLNEIECLLIERLMQSLPRALSKAYGDQKGHHLEVGTLIGESVVIVPPFDGKSGIYPSLDKLHDLKIEAGECIEIACERGLGNVSDGDRAVGADDVVDRVIKRFVNLFKSKKGKTVGNTQVSVMECPYEEIVDDFRIWEEEWDLHKKVVSFENPKCASEFIIELKSKYEIKLK